jgi:signal peptidase I
MEPLLSEGNILVGDLRAAGRLPRRGDVVSFVGPGDLIYFRRVVGLPGDVVAFDGPRLLVNGQPTTPADWPGAGEGDWIAAETLPDAAGPGYSVLCRGSDVEYTRSMPALTVPSGTVFFVGDHRCSSVDSRHFGPIPQEAIRSQVILRLKPEVTWLVDRGSLQR